jgi:hypothetical protein
MGDDETTMTLATLDGALLKTLADIAEIEFSGFTVREGLAGTGVTMLKGRNYFGSWRADGDRLVWVSADLSEPSHAVPTVDEAVRHTLLLILRNLETVPPKATNTALAG